MGAGVGCEPEGAGEESGGRLGSQFRLSALKSPSIGILVGQFSGPSGE